MAIKLNGLEWRAETLHKNVRKKKMKKKKNTPRCLQIKVQTV